MSTQGRISRTRKLLLVVGSLLVTLVVAELVVRMFVENPITSIERTRFGWKVHGLRNDELLEYSFEPGVQSRMVLADNYDVSFRINGQGLRDDVEHALDHPGLTRILLVGDSFIFGVGVEFEHSIGELLEAELNADPAWGRPTEVVAVGCPSYGLDSYAKIIERWKPRLDPDLVIVAICLGNDLMDYDLKAEDPSVVVGGFRVSQHAAWSYHVRRVSTLAHMFLKSFNPHRRFRANRPAQPTPEQLAALHATMTPWIERTVAACGPDGPPLAVTLMHGKQAHAAWQQGRLGFSTPPIDAVLADYEAGGALILDPKPAWIEAEGDTGRYFHPTDSHYTVEGSLLVARYLAAAVRERLGDTLPRP